MNVRLERLELVMGGGVDDDDVFFIASPLWS